MRKPHKQPSFLISDLVMKAYELQENFILLSDCYSAGCFNMISKLQMFAHFFNAASPNVEKNEDVKKFYQVAAYMMFLFLTRKADKDIDLIIEAIMNDKNVFDWVAKQQTALETLVNADDVIEMLENALAGTNLSSIAKHSVENFYTN